MPINDPAGWSTFDPVNNQRLAVPLSVRLDIPRNTRVGRASVVKAWAIEVAGDATPGAKPSIHDHARLHEGYRGAPVIFARRA